MSELFKFLRCFCIAVFVAFRMQALGIFTVGPRLWIAVVGIRVENTFLTRAGTPDHFQPFVS